MCRCPRWLPAFQSSIWKSSLSGCLHLGWCLRLEHRQYLLGEEFQPAFANLVGHAAKAECDVKLEIAAHLAARLEAPQDLVGRAPARGLHEAGACASQAALAGDFGLLLVGVVAF